MGRGHEETILQRRHADNITDHEGNAYQTHSEILLHSSQMAIIKKSLPAKMEA